MSFSFADAYARQVRQRLEQEKPAGRPTQAPAQANENLPPVTPEEAEMDNSRQSATLRKT